MQAADAAAARAAIGIGTFVLIEDFGPNADYAAALSAGIDAAVAVGGMVIHEVGKGTYSANSGVAKVDVPVRVDWNRARVV